MKIKLSIIVPVYNAEYFLEHSISSLLNQTYKNIEILLINDGSIDNSLNECKRLQKVDKRIVVIDKENSGVSSTRNLGIEKARGEYITFIDSDDYIELNAYENCMNILENNDIDFLKFSYYKESQKNKIKYNFSLKQNEVLNMDNKNEYLKEIFSTKDFEGIWNLIVKKDFIISNNIKFDENLIVAEDFKFMVNCISYAHKIYILNEPYYHYVINLNSVTQKYNLTKIIIRCDNIIKSYIDCNSLLNIDLNSNHYCIKKITKQLHDKISIISNYESYKVFKDSVEKINNLDSFKKLCLNSRMNKISSNYMYFLKLKLKSKIKNIIKKVVYR